MNEVQYLAAILGPDRPDIMRLVGLAQRNSSTIEFVRRRLALLCKREGVDPASPSPFAPYPEPAAMDIAGLHAGRLVDKDMDVKLSEAEINGGVLVTGCHRSGKTNLGFILAEQLVKIDDLGH